MNDREEIVAERERTLWRIIETWIWVVKRQERKIKSLEARLQQFDGSSASKGPTSASEDK